ncbi:hypothetical protein JXA40_08495 [bacterium]|nr:hypothetical protein [candidate division CSSED10-310 bacterium]
MDLRGLNFKSETGDSKGVSIALLLIGAVLVLSIWKIGVPLFKYMQLANYAKKQVNYSRENRVLDHTMLRIMHDKVYNYAVSLKLPLEDSQVMVDREGERAIMTIKYDHPIDMIFFRFKIPFHFHHMSEGIGFK